MKIFLHNGLDVRRYSDARRSMPRAPELRESDYENRFDATTLFYDLFQGETSQRIYVVAPPRAGFEHIFDPSAMTADGARPVSVAARELGKVFVVAADFAAPVDTLELPLAGGSVCLRPSPSHLDLFAGRNVAVTCQKDNHPRWIADWMKFYARVHGIDAFLLYDNGSEHYSLSALAQALRDAVPEALICMICWDFRYGPISRSVNIWDSNFLQFGMLQHARLRFLTRANCVLNCDIDELIEPLAAVTLPEAVHAAEEKFIAISGEWVEHVVVEKKAHYSFADYQHVHADEAHRKWPPKKWILADPTRTGFDQIWRVHDAIGRRSDPSQAQRFRLRHFRGISDYRPKKMSNRGKTVHDPDLGRLLRSVFSS